MRLYIRHKLAWVLLPIIVFQIVSVILVYDHVTFGAAADNVIWFGSALPRVLQRFRQISSYYETIAVSNPLGSLFSFALAACCAWSLLLPDTFFEHMPSYNTLQSGGSKDQREAPTNHEDLSYHCWVLALDWMYVVRNRTQSTVQLCDMGL
jgi:hypothetical protein